MKYLTVISVVGAILSTSTSYGAEIDTASMLHRAISTNEESAAQNFSSPFQKQVQLIIGGVCRNGLYYCVGVGTGPVGASCCGCGFCGWWSTN
jgi:hypothetical protein